jgi:hypothetical protein
LGGYHGAKMGRYQDLIDLQLQPMLPELIEQLRSGDLDLSQFQVLNMLNTKYLIGGTETSQIIPNRNAYGNAWMVDDIIKVSSANEEINKLSQTNLKKTAIVRDGLLKENVSGSGNIRLKSYTPRELTYSASISGGKGLAVFSEIYYEKGWEAYIDDRQAKIIPVNYLLRGLVIPEGDHTIRFIFNPSSYTTGNIIMTIFSAILLILIFLTIYFIFPKRKKSEI